MIYFIGKQIDMFSTIPTATMEECVEYCKSKDILGCDTETSGLDFISDRLIMLQIGDTEKQFVIDVRHIDIEPLRAILESQECLKLFHNVKFDYKFLRSAGIICENVWDCMLAEQVLHCGKEVPKGFYSLGGLSEKYLNIKMEKDTRMSFVKTPDAPFTEAQIVYGAKDVAYLIEIREHQEAILEAKELSLVAQLENDAALAFADIEFNGMGFNTEAWLDLAEKAKIHSAGIQNELDEFVKNSTRLDKFVAKSFQGDLFIAPEEIRKVEIKWSSPKQCLEVFKTHGLNITSTNAKTLAKFTKDPLIAKFVEYKETVKKVTSFGAAFLKYLHKTDKRIRTSFFQILETGRISSSKPNLQQVPSSNDYRNCFTPGIPGWVFVSSDYASQELVLIASASKDPVWLQALRDGKDLHSVCAALVYGDEWTEVAEEGCAFMEREDKCDCSEHKRLRTNVKSINFGLSYGLAAQGLSEALQITKDEADTLIDVYFHTFPKIRGFLTKLGNYGKRNGHIKTFAPYKRTRWFSGWEVARLDKYGKDSFRIMSSIERASKNSPIQGSAADCTKEALVLIRETIRDNNYPVKLVMTVHDQVDTICPEEFAEKWSDILTEKMEEAALTVVPSGLLKSDTNISAVWEK